VTGRAPAELWTAELAAAADAHTMQRLGVPSPLLMERAALCVSHEVMAFRLDRSLPVVVLAGPGNNGGDGVAVARQLHGWGVPVSVVLAAPRPNAALAEQLAIARAYGVTVGTRWPAVSEAIVVDALLGTGSRGVPRGVIAETLARAGAVAGPRVAVDLPTGVDPGTGACSPDAFVADVTVTFARSKPGLHLTPGRARAGRVIVADIGLQGPPDRERPLRLSDPTWVGRGLGPVTSAAHKGERGHVAVVGGSGGTPGAAVLGGAAALRGGAGLCTIVTPDAEVRAELLRVRPELMTAAWSGDAVLPAADALVVGPGLTAGVRPAQLQALWTRDARPAVWDASALDHLVGAGAQPAGPRIVTPHPGEAARLLRGLAPDTEWNTAAVQANRPHAAATIARHTGATVVLKGEGTVVAHRDGTLAINVSGNANLATAGSGDVLAGLIGALLAAGVEAGVAAEAGVYAHGVAGELVASGATALELCTALPAALADLRAGADHPSWPRLRRG
jgi:NAD(P)H-hydrate epimerase